MDVERIQKINSLALELMKQGLASDREDAVNQAERIFKSKGASEYSSMRETMTKVEEQASPTAKMGSDSTPFAPDQMKEILEQNTKFIVSKLKEMGDRIAAVEKDIASVNNKLTYNRPVQQQEAPKLGEIPANNPQIQRGQGATVSASNHPRSGNYNEGDVSIEKFFYMGRK